MDKKIMNKTNLIKFATPYYAEKDIMHNMWHIELVEKLANKILETSNYNVNINHLTLATYFHGFIYSHENDIKAWLNEQGFPENEISKIIEISYESQRVETPKSIEGKILHDAHLLEGGKAYTITKCLITGSLRGQSLTETIEYIETNIIDKSKCYLPETIKMLNEANLFTKDFLRELKNGLV